MVERKIKILMAAHVLISIWLVSIWVITNWYTNNWCYFFSPGNFVAGMSLAIVYCLYRSNKVMYHKISIINILFFLILFLIYYLLVELGPFFVWSQFLPFFDVFIFGSPLFYIIPILPSIVTMWYANKSESELYSISFIIIGIILIATETPIFINSVEEIPAIRASFYLADIYGLGYDKSYYSLKHTLLIGILSLVGMTIGVILMIKGSVRLLKSKMENH